MAKMRLAGVAKSFAGASVITNVELCVEDGEFVVFVGPSGCGKSTLLRMIAGLEPVSDGRVFIDEIDVTTFPPAQRGVAMVFQNYALYPHMTVEENIAFGLKIAGVGRQDRHEKALAAAKILKLEGLLERRPKDLSGGQRQRVAIGRAIVKKPKIFLFDEPLSNLDAELRVQTRLEIAKLHQGLRATMIYVTHDQSEAMTLADKIVVLRGGGIEQVGRPMDLYMDPVNAFVAGFIGSPQMNFVNARVVSSAQECWLIEAPLLGGARFAVRPRNGGVYTGSEVTLGFRPEHVTVNGPTAGIAGQIEVVERLGNVSYLYVRCEGGARVTLEQRSVTSARNGESIRFGVDPQRLLIFDSRGRRL
jgi:lactose/L-arabinose transport system ATP-binding protein